MQSWSPWEGVELKCQISMNLLTALCKHRGSMQWTCLSLLHVDEAERIKAMADGSSQGSKSSNCALYMTVMNAWRQSWFAQLVNYSDYTVLPISVVPSHQFPISYRPRRFIYNDNSLFHDDYLWMVDMLWVRLRNETKHFIFVAHSFLLNHPDDCITALTDLRCIQFIYSLFK